jgi:hypothetical protein
LQELSSVSVFFGGTLRNIATSPSDDRRFSNPERFREHTGPAGSPVSQEKCKRIEQRFDFK